MNLEDVEARLDYIEGEYTFDIEEGISYYDEIIHWREQLAKHSVYNQNGLEYEFEEYNG